MDGLTIGTQVLYVLPTGPSKGQDRPAIVVNDLSSTVGDGVVNLQVFIDGANDAPYDPAIKWVTYVSYDNSTNKAPGTWHFPGATMAPASASTNTK